MTLTGAAGTQALIVNASANESVDLSGLKFSSWATGTDTITVNGTGGNETIHGSSQNDTLAGGAGVDR